jgi:hypothetical protein
MQSRLTNASTSGRLGHSPGLLFVGGFFFSAPLIRLRIDLLSEFGQFFISRIDFKNGRPRYPKPPRDY